MSGTDSAHWLATGDLDLVEGDIRRLRDYTASEPDHLLDKARAFIAGV